MLDGAFIITLGLDHFPHNSVRKIFTKSMSHKFFKCDGLFHYVIEKTNRLRNKIEKTFAKNNKFPALMSFEKIRASKDRQS